MTRDAIIEMARSLCETACEGKLKIDNCQGCPMLINTDASKPHDGIEQFIEAETDYAMDPNGHIVIDFDLKTMGIHFHHWNECNSSNEVT